MPPPPRPTHSETPAPAGERIAKVLARAGVASRRDAEAMIAEGRVQVNGRAIDSPALNVTAKDRILVDGKPLAAAEPPRLWLYHKPAGLVTSARDEKGRPTVFDRLPEGMPRVMPVGRLDITSEGLLLLTNDGGVKRKLELPATGWLRKYRVRVRGRPDEAQLDPLRKGIVIEGERFQPMQVSLDRQQGANAWLTVGIREGRNREVRRAMEAVGLIVNRLIRTGYGPFQLGDLAPGAVEEVRPRILRDQLGLSEVAEPPEAKARASGRAEKAGKPGKAAKTRAAPAGRPAGAAKPERAEPRGEGRTPRAGAGKSRGGSAPEGSEAAVKKPFRSWASKRHEGAAGTRPDTRSAGATPRSRGMKRHDGGARPGKPRETGPRR